MDRVIYLDAISESLLSQYANLRWKSKSDQGIFVVEGRLCVQRLLASKMRVESILVQKGRENEIFTWEFDHKCPIYVLPADKMKELVGFDFHRGFLASAYRPKTHDLDDFDWSRTVYPIVLAAFGVTETENLGSMLRTAAAFGVENIFLDKKSADPFARRCVRVSMGTVFKQRFYFLDQTLEQLTNFVVNNHSRTVVTTLCKQAIPIHQWQADHRPVVLVMGNEATGVDAQIESVASDLVTIPMDLNTDSLNVAVATGICLYSLRQACRA